MLHRLLCNLVFRYEYTPILINLGIAILHESPENHCGRLVVLGLSFSHLRPLLHLLVTGQPVRDGLLLDACLLLLRLYLRLCTTPLGTYLQQVHARAFAHYRSIMINLNAN